MKSTFRLRTLYWLAILPVFMFVLSGCLDSPYYQREYSLPDNEWKYSNKPSFKFEITDTAARYNIYFLIRHTEAYPFSNIWMMIYSKAPQSKIFDTSRVEVPLAESSGKWLGRGMGTVWEQRLPINAGDAVVFPKAGTYEMKLEQNMRIDPLPEVLQVGLRIEKITGEK